VREREIADTSNPQLGFAFHPRCRYAVDACRAVVPEMTEAHLTYWIVVEIFI
jgi:ABC-type dipeptide/oligopeptide/nickel transport system ATPase component